MLRPEESRIFPLPANDVQMRASSRLVRNSTVRLGALTPSGKRLPVRLERNDFVRSSTAWINKIEGELSFVVRHGSGEKCGADLANGGYLRLRELDNWGVA
jgi:hypothetical protein